jgi:hypothetical protein
VLGAAEEKFRPRAKKLGSREVMERERKSW